MQARDFYTAPPAARPDFAATPWAICTLSAPRFHPLPPPPTDSLTLACPSWNPQPTLLSSPTGRLDALSVVAWVVRCPDASAVW